MTPEEQGLEALERYVAELESLVVVLRAAKRRRRRRLARAFVAIRDRALADGAR